VVTNGGAEEEGGGEGGQKRETTSLARIVPLALDTSEERYVTEVCDISLYLVLGQGEEDGPEGEEGERFTEKE